MHRLILASESPRRKDLLHKAGIRFQVFPVKISEIPNKTLNVPEQILDIAGRKARAAFDAFSEREKASPSSPRPFVVLSADTEVIFDGGPLGKPSSAEEAVKTLTRLSGRVHEVITAVQMIDSSDGKTHSHLETSRVFFRTLSEKEIRAYVATGDPMDKAGSYGIQSGGGVLVEKIEGDFDNIVGLPVRAVLEIFKKQNWDFSE